MTTITRQQLCDAIEVGIAGARSSFTDEHAIALRTVGAKATVVARVDFENEQARCPLAIAYPDWRKRYFEWDLEFCSAYDGVTRAWDYRSEFVLRVADDDPAQGRAS